MFKALLVHRDNTPLKNKVKILEKFDTESFDFGNSDLDTYVSQKFISKLQKKDFNILFIKDSLSDNYLELYGITLAYYIRLSAELGDKRFVPIVIISDVDGYILNKLTPMANILFTKNTFVARNEISSYDYFEKVFEQIKPFNDFKKEFLDLINIDPPQDYLSHHDITNEWSIYRWAEFLKIDTATTKANKAKIENMLYFKYLKALYPITDYYIENDNEADLLIDKQVKSSSLKIVKKVEKPIQKVLYIDDEWDKGWEDIFKEFFSKKHKQEFQLETISEINKDTNYDSIEALVKDSLTSKSIDAVILDMRLTKEDHEQTNVKELSGVKLLELIKSFNPGIQVILLTASEKSAILDEANKYNILGYIKKESPSDDSIYTKTVFEKLKTLIDSGFDKKYLKDIWNIQQEILKLDIFVTDKYNEIKKEVEFIFELLDSSMEKRFKFAMLTIYKVLEIIKDIYIDDKSGKYLDDEEEIKAVVFKNNIYIAVKKDILLSNPEDYGFNDTRNKTAKQNSQKYYYSTTNKICAILYEKFGFTQEKELYDNVVDISRKRNRYIHPDNGQTIEVKEDDILKWFQMLQKILSTLK